MSTNFAIVSVACPACSYFSKYHTALQADGVCIIALDSPLSDCVRDLLSALQVNALPSIIINGRLYAGHDAFNWAKEMYPNTLQSQHIPQLSTTIPELLKIIATEHMDLAFAKAFKGFPVTQLRENVA